MLYLTILLNLIILTHKDGMSLNSELVLQADNLFVLDYDNDGKDEFLIKKEFRYYLTDQKNTSYFQINFPDEDYMFISSLNIDNKPPEELVFRCKKDNDIWIYIYSENNLQLQFKAITGKDIKKPDGWDGDICIAKLSDINDDHYKDLILLVNTGFDMMPRGVMAYDLKHNCELWHFWIGGSPRNLYVVDINNDGKEEIIMSTTAVSNGSVVNGFGDNKSYVIVFDKKGGILWHKEIGGVFSDALCWIGSLENKNEIELVLVECEGTGNKSEPNQILILEGKDGETKKFIRSGEKYCGMAVCDIDRDEKKEIITGNTDGIIRVYNSNLDPLMIQDIGKSVNLIDASDLDGDGTTELLARTVDNQLLILNEYLQQVGFYNPQGNCKFGVSIVRNGQKKKLLVCSGENEPYSYSLLSVTGPNMFAIVSKSNFFISSLVIFFILIIVVISLFFYSQKLKKELCREREQSLRILEWSGFAQRLAHEIKNPLSTINLTLQRMHQLCKERFGKKADIVDGCVESILEEVERLRTTTDRFMRVLSIDKPKFTQVDINELLNSLLRKYKNILPEQLKLKIIFAQDLPLVRCDEGQITTAFVNILENAIEAMEGKGIISVRTSLVEKIRDKVQIINKETQAEPDIKRLIEIRIEDTGKGLSSDQMQNLFKPFYSTKENGTGLGLVIAKRIIEAHKGDILISSKKGIGTVVTVLLPIVGV
uniref:histidine kinase n=1 Tax=candidate division WOR-3 bacterium TaxID=2052148 RepID=A0A7C6AFJ3_UNCW3